MVRLYSDSTINAKFPLVDVFLHGGRKDDLSGDEASLQPSCNVQWFNPRSWERTEMKIFHSMCFLSRVPFNETRFRNQPKRKKKREKENADGVNDGKHHHAGIERQRKRQEAQGASTEQLQPSFNTVKEGL